jgi:hypothetical protein
MPQSFLPLSPARETTRAPGDRLALRLNHLRSTDWALGRQFYLRSVIGHMLNDAHDLGNYVASATNDHRVTNTHVLTPHFINVV